MEEMWMERILCHYGCQDIRDSAFAQCMWVEELETVEPVLSRLTMEISCYGMNLIRCCYTQCACPMSCSPKVTNHCVPAIDPQGSWGVWSFLNIELCSLQACTQTLCWMRLALAPQQICMYANSERNQGTDIGYRKLQCPAVVKLVTVHVQAIEQIKSEGGGKTVNEACMTVDIGGKSG